MSVLFMIFHCFECLKNSGEWYVMENENVSASRVPDFKGEGVAVWKNLDKNGKTYLSVVILGNIRLNAFKYEAPKPKQVVEDF